MADAVSRAVSAMGAVSEIGGKAGEILQTSALVRSATRAAVDALALDAQGLAARADGGEPGGMAWLTGPLLPDSWPGAAAPWARRILGELAKSRMNVGLFLGSLTG